MNTELAALRAGYLSQELRYCQQRIWVDNPCQALDVQPYLNELDRILLALSAGINTYQRQGNRIKRPAHYSRELLTPSRTARRILRTSPKEPEVMDAFLKTHGTFYTPLCRSS